MSNRIRDLPLLALLALTMCGGPSPTPDSPGPVEPDPLAQWEAIAESAETWIRRGRAILDTIPPGGNPELRQALTDALDVAEPAAAALRSVLALVRAGQAGADELEAEATKVAEAVAKLIVAVIRVEAQERRTLEARGS